MKKFRILISILCLTTMVLGSQVAFATSHDFAFVFTNLNSDITNSYAKSDAEPSWYISLDAANPNGRNNNVSSNNIFGCRMHKNSDAFVSGYHTFSNYVSGYPLSYTETVYNGEIMYMGAKKDDSSSSSETLRASGRFAP